MSYRIVTESNTDLPPELADSLGIDILPMIFAVNGVEYLNMLDGSTYPFAEFYNKLREGANTMTAQVTAYSFAEVFEKHLKEGTDILYLGFSSGLSGTYNQSVQAAEELRTRYPDRKIVTIDTLCASMGQGLMVYLACKQRDAGKSIDEVADFVKGLIPNLCHWVVVDDLNHLRRGGRVSSTTAFVGTLLGIKPIIHVDNEGKLIPVAKARGRQKAIEYVINKIAETAINPAEQTIFISHADALEDAQFLEDKIKERFGTKDIVISWIGPVIGSHSGPGTLALFFIGKER